jgi:hypothetical protein
MLTVAASAIVLAVYGLKVWLGRVACHKSAHCGGGGEVWTIVREVALGDAPDV